MYQQTSAAGLASPETHAAVAAWEAPDPGPPSAYEQQHHHHHTSTEKASSRGGGTVHRQQSGTGMDMSKQLAKRTQAFEQLSAFLQ